MHFIVNYTMRYLAIYIYIDIYIDMYNILNYYLFIHTPNAYTVRYFGRVGYTLTELYIVLRNYPALMCCIDEFFTKLRTRNISFPSLCSSRVTVVIRDI